MSFNQKINKWSQAHVFYNMFTHDPGENAPKGIKLEYEWRMKMLKETPNGRLLTENSLFNTLRTSSKIYLAHITPHLEQIMQSGSIYPSGGCLLGGVYTTPIFQENGKFRLHNLGRYILKEEAPRAAYLQQKNNPDILIIEVTLPPNNHENLIGVDYTRLGDIHFDVYKELEYLLSFKERLELYDVILKNVKNSLAFLNFANCAYVNKKEIVPETFFELYLAAIDHLPILGYLYFEVISEYLMLNEDSKEAKYAHSVGEFYNNTYKDLMFDLYPGMLKGQSIGTFKPTLKQVGDYIIGKKIISKFNKDEMSRYLTDRLNFLVNARLFNNDNGSLTDWRDIKWDFDSLSIIARKLLGHLLHREFRNFGRYPDFYFYFDQQKALQIWNYWNHMDTVIPFNGCFPKGEMGLNPAWPDLEYNIYSSKLIKDDRRGIILELGEKLDIKVVPRLVNIKYTTMRSKGLNNGLIK